MRRCHKYLNRTGVENGELVSSGRGLNKKTTPPPPPPEICVCAPFFRAYPFRLGRETKRATTFGASPVLTPPVCESAVLARASNKGHATRASPKISRSAQELVGIGKVRALKATERPQSSSSSREKQANRLSVAETPWPFSRRKARVRVGSAGNETWNDAYKLSAYGFL